MKKIWLVISLVVVAAVVFSAGYMIYFFLQMGVVSTGAPIAHDAVDRPALVVIDIQEGITGKLASSFSQGLVQQAEPFIQTVNRAIEKAQAKHIPVIYVRQENTDPIANLLTGGKFLAAGTPQTAVDQRVRQVPGPTLIKHKMDTFTNPEFDSFLRANRINHLIVTGLDASQCVDRTMKGALQRGYSVTAISDAIISSTVGKKEEMFRRYTKEGVAVIPLDQLQ